MSGSFTIALRNPRPIAPAPRFAGRRGRRKRTVPAKVGTPCHGVPETQRSAGVSESPAVASQSRAHRNPVAPALRFAGRRGRRKRTVPTTVGTPCYGVPETQRSAGVSESPAVASQSRAHRNPVAPAPRFAGRRGRRKRTVPTVVGTPCYGVPETQRSVGVSESPTHCEPIAIPSQSPCAGPTLRWPEEGSEEGSGITFYLFACWVFSCF
jgi:hypothetical protein